MVMPVSLLAHTISSGYNAGVAVFAEMLRTARASMVPAHARLVGLVEIAAPNANQAAMVMVVAVPASVKMVDFVIT